eukprot:TRINITY_DN19322_c1_g2_i1.p1 TRINITY_DN19322_c1_g2~~TRINITY_DN19322_c1_g2_i1.p1  ORF type:complete len:334 (-),score=41.60 TRINITY_DN19322_c1_g2_i1:29-1030(-)
MEICRIKNSNLQQIYIKHRQKNNQILKKLSTNQSYQKFFSDPVSSSSAKSNDEKTNRQNSRREVVFLGSMMLIGSCNLFSKEAAVGMNNCEKLTILGDQTKNPGVDWVILNKDKQLFYPEWFQGQWESSAKLIDVKFPLGMKYISRSTPGVTQASIAAALPDVGAGQDNIVKYTTSFYYSPQEGGTVADRIQNIKQLMENFLKDKVTQVTVDYDPIKNPTRLAVRYNTKRKNRDEESFDYRKAEIFINARKSFKCGANEFGSYELYRQVNQAKNQGYIGDYLVSNFYRLENENQIQIQQKVSAFLQPQDPLFFEVGDRAVAEYSYSINMQRIS